MTGLEKKQHEMLKWLEWDEKRSCPVCEGVEPQHEDDCELAAMLAEAVGQERKGHALELAGELAWRERRRSPGAGTERQACPQCGSEASYASAGTEAKVRAHPAEWHTWAIQEGDAG